MSRKKKEVSKKPKAEDIVCICRQPFGTRGKLSRCNQCQEYYHLRCLRQKSTEIFLRSQISEICFMDAEESNKKFWKNEITKFES